MDRHRAQSRKLTGINSREAECGAGLSETFGATPINKRTMARNNVILAGMADMIVLSPLHSRLPYSAAMALVNRGSSRIVSWWLPSFGGLIRNHTAYSAGRKSRIITVPAAVPPISV